MSCTHLVSSSSTTPSVFQSHFASRMPLDKRVGAWKAAKADPAQAAINGLNRSIAKATQDFLSEVKEARKKEQREKEQQEKEQEKEQSLKQEEKGGRQDGDQSGQD